MKLLKDFSGGIAYGEINEKDCLAIYLFDFFSGGVFIYKNTRSDSLHIYYIVSSCDCLETRCSKYHAAPGDTLQLKVFFQSDSIGVFVRELYIYGNFPSLPLSLTVEGDCI